MKISRRHLGKSLMNKSIKRLGLVNLSGPTSNDVTIDAADSRV